MRWISRAYSLSSLRASMFFLCNSSTSYVSHTYNGYARKYATTDIERLTHSLFFAQVNPFRSSQKNESRPYFVLIMSSREFELSITDDHVLRARTHSAGITLREWSSSLERYARCLDVTVHPVFTRENVLPIVTSLIARDSYICEGVGNDSRVSIIFVTTSKYGARDSLKVCLDPIPCTSISLTFFARVYASHRAEASDKAQTGENYDARVYASHRAEASGKA